MEIFTSSRASNLERLKQLKKKTLDLSLDYHLIVEKLKDEEKNIMFIVKKTGVMDKKIDKIIKNYRYCMDFKNFRLLSETSKNKKSGKNRKSYKKI